MDLDDLFEGKSHHRNYSYGHDHSHDDHGHKRYEHSNRDNHFDEKKDQISIGYVKEFLKNKNSLKLMIIAAIIFGCLFVVICIAVVSMSGPLLAFISKNGIKGIVELILPIVQRIWEGSGK